MALDEMCRAAGEERRRTERRRGALRRLFPQIEELADGTTKRFRILGGFFQCPSTEELLEFERTIEELRNQHATARDETLRTVEQDEVTNHAVVAGRDRRGAGLVELAGTGPPPRRGGSISAAIINNVSSVR
jgi:hypothetical protein